MISMNNMIGLRFGATVVTALLLWLPTALKAQGREESGRPVFGSYRLEVGRRTAYSSYLSPFSYAGTDFALSGFWTKMLPQNPHHLAMHFDGRVNFASLENPAGSASEYDLHALVSWGLEWQKRWPGYWTFGAGGEVGVWGGMLYLMRNSNNPVSAQFSTGISAGVYGSKLLRIGKLPVLVSDRISLPLASGFFCQDYGEPYYEIYLGNRKGLAHFGWPGNRFGINNLLMVTLDLGRTAMELGYRFTFQNEQANNLTTRLTSHMFVVGVIPGGLGIKTRRSDSVTPLY